MRLVLLLAVLGACDPAFGVRVKLRDPANRPIEGATVAIACGAEAPRGYLGRTDRDGTGFAGSIGGVFPPGCDVFIAKQGFQTQHIRYHDLCPTGDDSCERYFVFDMFMPPAPE